MATRHDVNSPEQQQAEGTWKQFKGRMKEAWGSLTDDELDRLEGRKDQIEGLIQQRTGQKREEVRDELNRLSRESNYRW